MPGGAYLRNSDSNSQSWSDVSRQLPGIGANRHIQMIPLNYALLLNPVVGVRRRVLGQSTTRAGKCQIADQTHFDTNVGLTDHNSKRHTYEQ